MIVSKNLHNFAEFGVEINDELWRLGDEKLELPKSFLEQGSNRTEWKKRLKADRPVLNRFEWTSGLEQIQYSAVIHFAIAACLVIPEFRGLIIRSWLKMFIQCVSKC